MPWNVPADRAMLAAVFWVVNLSSQAQLRHVLAELPAPRPEITWIISFFPLFPCAPRLPMLHAEHPELFHGFISTDKKLSFIFWMNIITWPSWDTHWARLKREKMDNKTHFELSITTHIAQKPAKAGGGRDFHHCNLARCIWGSRKEHPAPQDQGHVNSSSQSPLWQAAKLAPQPRWPCSGREDAESQHRGL